MLNVLNILDVLGGGGNIFSIAVPMLMGHNTIEVYVNSSASEHMGDIWYFSTPSEITTESLDWDYHYYDLYNGTPDNRLHINLLKWHPAEPQARLVRVVFNGSIIYGA